MTLNCDVTASKIKKAYPNPEVSARPLTNNYCVGGAFCLYLRWQCEKDTIFLSSSNLRFPTVGNLATLFEIYLELPREKALAHARVITQLNDSGHFTDAWHELALAIKTSPYRKAYLEGRKNDNRSD